MTRAGRPPAPADTVRLFVAGARPRTLPATLMPVAVGLALAHSQGELDWWHGVLALVVAVALQVATNYANDYSDGMRGADAERVGPKRLVGGGLASPRSVKRAAIASFALAALAGLVLAIVVSPWLLVVGAASIAAGWFYTGGRRPYGYLGYGELFVFVFFGPVAVIGTAYVSSGRLLADDAVAAVPVGLLAVALLVVNNLRDIPGDARSNKRTLAVRLGDGWTRRLYLGIVAFALASAAAMVPWRPVACLGLLAAVVAVAPARLVASNATGRALVPALVLTGTLQLVFGALFAIGIAL